MKREILISSTQREIRVPFAGLLASVADNRPGQPALDG
jgi:hypothetical protein